MKKNIIYIYTTKTWRTLGYYKIGGTKLSGKIRVEQQDGTSLSTDRIVGSSLFSIEVFVSATSNSNFF